MTPPEPVSIDVEIEVRYAETDQMGVVHHSNYLVWFELARTRLCAESGLGYDEIEHLGYLLMVTAAELSYRRGVRYGDVVSVGVHIERLGSRGLRFAYTVTRDGEVAATGATEHVWVDAARRRPCRIPERLRPEFERLAAARLPG